MGAYLGKYHVEIDGEGYLFNNNRDGLPYYEKKRAPAFVNKFGSGDSSYRDATFWQFWASTNWRNGAKQLRLDDPGKFWKSKNVNVNQLDEVTLSRDLTLVGQTAAGTKINDIEAWRTSQSWWNASYGYRQQLTITAPSAQQAPAGHPILLSIDTAALQTATKLLANRNDWRVVYFNGSSSVDLSRDYIDATHTFFALQAAIPAGASDSNYFIYYGNAAEATNKQPTTEAEWNAVYGMYGTTPDANSIAIYHMREGSGTTLADDTTNANTGTITGATWVTDGKFGRALRFTGTTTDNHVDLGSGSGFNLGSLTIEGWFKPSLTGDQDHFFSRKVTGASQEAYGFHYDGGGGQWDFKTSDGATQDSTTVSQTPPVIPNGSYKHVAITYDGSTKKIVIEGVTVASEAISGAIATSEGSLMLGAKHDLDSAGFYAGDMQHVRVSNIARTSFPYVLATEPSVTAGSETTTLPPTSSFEVYVGNSNGKVYKVSGSTITEEFDTRRLTWHETGNDTNMVIGDTGGTETAQAQSFQVAAATKMKAVQVYLKKSTGTPGDITVRIETNNVADPSGTLVDATNATATIPAFTTSSYGWVTVEFPAAFSLSAATTYWIVLKTAAAANDNYYHWAADGASPAYASGNMNTSTDGGTTWSADTAKDAYFRVLSESTSVNDLLVSQVGGTQKLLIGTGSMTSQTNGDARLYSFDGSNYTLEKTFASSTESQVTKLAEYNGKLYAAVGPQARIYEGTAPGTWALSKDINTPQNPGLVYTLKEYNGRLYAGGGSPEFLPDKHYNGFWYVFDGTTWASLYPFEFTELRSFEFYDAFLFGSTYDGRIYVYDTASLNPLFNFKDDYDFRVNVMSQQLFDDKIYFFLYPQDNSNEENVGIWVFDRHGMSLAYHDPTITGYRCAAVVNNFLYIGTGDDGNIYKLDPDAYNATGELQTSYFDATLPSIDKLYNSIELQHDPLGNGQNIKVYYKFKESDSWTLLGTSSTVAATSKTLSFPTGTYSRKISLKVELNTTDTATSPKLKEVVLQYTLYPKRKWQWSMRLRASTAFKLLDKTSETKTAAQIRTDLEAAQNGYKLVSFTDVDGTQYTVLFSDLDHNSWVINQDTSNEDEVAITLIEA